MVKEFICICCPIGCHLVVDKKSSDEIVVSGNRCNRGKNYAISEITAPKRMVTSSVKIVGGNCQMLSVKTSEPILKELIFDSLKQIENLTVFAPIKIGDVIFQNILGTGIDFIATRNVEKI